MKKVNRLFSILIALAMIVCNVGGNAEGISGEIPVDSDVQKLLANFKESRGFEFLSNGDGTCTLTKIGSCDDEIVVIPLKSPAGDTVTTIGEYAFYDCDDGFYECKKLKTVSIGSETVESEIVLDDYVFQSSKSLETVVLGKGEVEIEDRVFSYCEAFRI